MPVRREDVGASTGGQSWGLCQREREAGVRGNWMLPSANADAPTSLSNLLLFGPHGIGGALTRPLRRERVVA
jgi:hypothetical protein